MPTCHAALAPCVLHARLLQVVPLHLQHPRQPGQLRSDSIHGIAHRAPTTGESISSSSHVYSALARRRAALPTYHAALASCVMHAPLRAVSLAALQQAYTPTCGTPCQERLAGGDAVLPLIDRPLSASCLYYLHPPRAAGRTSTSALPLAHVHRAGNARGS